MALIDNSKFSLFSFEGKNFLIGYCGGIYNLTSDFVDLINNGTIEDLNLAEKMKLELKKIEEIEMSADDIPSMPGRTLRALCLNVTSACNLSCIYCFAHGEGKLSGHMSLETALQSLNFLLEKSNPEATLQIDFFGGEPLLNFDMIKKFVIEAKKKTDRIKFTLTTNAVLLTEDVLEFLNLENISLILSLDGDKIYNDLNRPSSTGESVWATAFTNIKRAIKSRNGDSYYVRGTITPNTMDIVKTCRFFVDNGIYRFSLEPAKGKSTDSWAVKHEHLQELCKKYEELAKFIIEKRKEGVPVDYFHFNIYLDSPLCSPRRLSGCGAGVEYLSIDPNGNIYPCHRLHMKEFSMGNIFENNKNFDIIRDKFEKTILFTKSKCNSCWARYYCSGGCHADAYLTNNNIEIPAEYDCILQKKRTQCAVWTSVSQKEN